MSHAMVNVDVTENSPTVKPSPYSPSVGIWIDGDTSLHFRDAGHLGEWLAAACEGLSALLDPAPVSEFRQPRDLVEAEAARRAGVLEFGAGHDGSDFRPLNSPVRPAAFELHPHLYRIPSGFTPVNPCSGSAMPDRQGEVEG